MLSRNFTECVAFYTDCTDFYQDEDEVEECAEGFEQCSLSLLFEFNLNGTGGGGGGENGGLEQEDLVRKLTRFSLLLHLFTLTNFLRFFIAGSPGPSTA